ncbi:MAG: hypothetical protein KatS3mg001_551 [Candidatus Pacearchaeota archaeon]|nr:MAG: hypothetical protein KatS3mg001_551 [Candidatus Pacearchaeota archaeon]
MSLEKILKFSIASFLFVGTIFYVFYRKKFNKNYSEDYLEFGGEKDLEIIKKFRNYGCL